MGRKNKSRNKMSGSEKTALKTEKKLNTRQRKELATLGEDNIEKIVAEIEQEEARRQCIKEVAVKSPSRRVNFTLTPHPSKDELIMFGGEFHDGQQTTVYGDMFFYNINKKEWTVVKAPGAPPPRCGHQTVATAMRGGELWIFGGEFSSPSELQFHHYRDLWVFRITEKKWEKITSPNSPSARSGHRMLYVRKQLIVFGGFHDNLKNYKYFNDVHTFDLENHVWHKIEIAGVAPAPRSACIFLPLLDNKILVYGGYSREKVKKDVDKGHVHDDMFLLMLDKNNATKYKWMCLRKTGMHTIPRCGISAVLIQPNQALMFGGVHDDENDVEDLRGTFYNNLFTLDLEKFQWHTDDDLLQTFIYIDASSNYDLENFVSNPTQYCWNVMKRKLQYLEKSPINRSSTTHRIWYEIFQLAIRACINILTLSGKKETTGQRRKKKQDKENEENSSCEDEEMSEKFTTQPTIITDDDGIFTVTVRSMPSETVSDANDTSSSDKRYRCDTVVSPSPRINTGMAVIRNILYLYGGIVEDNDRQYTFNDFYSLDCRKLDEWKVLITDDLSSQKWFYSSSDSEEDSCEDESDNDNNELIDVNKS